jgi:hypothetical protein
MASAESEDAAAADLAAGCVNRHSERRAQLAPKRQATPAGTPLAGGRSGCLYRHVAWRIQAAPYRQGAALLPTGMAALAMLAAAAAAAAALQELALNAPGMACVNRH